MMLDFFQYWEAQSTLTPTTAELFPPGNGWFQRTEHHLLQNPSPAPAADSPVPLPGRLKNTPRYLQGICLIEQFKDGESVKGGLHEGAEMMILLCSRSRTLRAPDLSHLILTSLGSLPPSTPHAHLQADPQLLIG